jgi:CBS domain-containing protein
MNCASIMRTPLEIGRSGETLQRAARRMRDANASFVVVTDGDGHLLGVVSDRDLAVRACARGMSPDQTTVDDVMSVEPVVCRPDDSLEWAVDLMALHQSTRLVVVDDEGCPLGMLGLADVAIHLDDAVATLRRVSVSDVFDESHHRISPRH